MTEAMQDRTYRGKSPASQPPTPPGFELAKVEIPTAVREMAHTSVSQAKEAYERMRSLAEEATDMLEDSYAMASKGATAYGLRAIEAARENTNAAFDLASRLMTVKSLAEVVELSTAHARRQFEALTAQAKELASIAQRTANETAEPVKETLGKVFKKVA
jgi:phasin